MWHKVVYISFLDKINLQISVLVWEKIKKIAYFFRNLWELKTF